MVFVCNNCGYETLIKCNFISHQNRKTPCKSRNVMEKKCENVNQGCENVNPDCENVNQGCENVNPDCENLNQRCENVKFECKKCNRNLSNKRNLENHVLICKGVDSLSCPTCKKRFKSYQGKYKHLKNVKCKPYVLPKSDMIPSTSIINSTNCNNTNCNNTNITTNITINAFGKENYKYIIENHDFMKKCIKDREYGLVECLKMIHYNDEIPENHNIKKMNKKDEFVDIYDGSKWKLRMIDFAYSQVMGTLEKLFTDYIDNLVDTGELEPMKRIVKVFCNRVSTVLDWEFNNIDKNREVEDIEMRQLQHKLKKLISETLYRETINNQMDNNL